MDPKTDGEDTAPDFLTAAEVAAWLRVGLSTVYSWTASGRIPSVRFNGIVRFQRSLLRGWIQQHTMCPASSHKNLPERINRTHPRQLTYHTLVEAAARVKKRLLSAKKPMPHGDSH